MSFPNALPGGPELIGQIHKVEGLDMRHLVLAAIAISLLAGCGRSTVSASTQHYTILNLSRTVEADGINKLRDVVGTYSLIADLNRGFLLHGGH